MLVDPKYLSYQDLERNVVLCSDIEGIVPYKIKLPEAPKPEDIVNFGLPSYEQMFKREVVPPEVKKLARATHRQAVLASIHDKVVGAFVEDQWQKRLHGQWQYINGVPTYLPGIEWFYLNHNRLDIGLPHYRGCDTNFWQWWQFAVVENPKVYGGIEFTRRRQGKTYRGGAILYEASTRERNALCGLQSKTDADAKGVLLKAIVKPWRKMPFYFSPMYDHKEYPRQIMHWRKPSEGRKDINISDLIDGDGLMSSIEARSSVEEAFDGEKLYRYLSDEIGKTTEVNVDDRWGFVKPCMEAEDTIVGKALCTTTVEEMEKKGGANFKKLWDKSSRKKEDVNDLGQTQSGLVRFFTPAYDNYIFDQYGNAIADKPTEQQAKWRKDRGSQYWKLGAKDILYARRDKIKDQEDRQSEIRKYPFSIKEAFRSSATDCPFNLEIINNRLDEFLYGNKYVIRGNFAWHNGERDTYVTFEATPNGRWIVSYLPDQEKSNQHYFLGGQKYPGSPDKFTSGADPYKYKVVSGKKKSLGVSHVHAYYDFAIDNGRDPEDQVTDDLCCEYAARPKSKQLFGEDMLMQCVYYGCHMFPEINVPFLWDYFEERGYVKFLRHRREKRKLKGRTRKVSVKTPGMTTLGDGMKDSLFTGVEFYIEKNGHRCKFPEFLEDCRDVDHDNLSPFDHFVSGAYTIYSSRMHVPSANKGGNSASSSKLFEERVYD